MNFFKHNISSCFFYNKNIKIGILGGSFNPAHDGHIHISKIAKKCLNLDEVWWLVAPQNRLKLKTEMEYFDKRLSYARSLTKKYAFIKVLDLEKQNNLFISYKTVNFLLKKTRNCSFIWLMGSDILEQFSKWIRPKDISKKMPIAIIERPSYSSKIINKKITSLLGIKMEINKSNLLYLKKNKSWIFIKKKLISISSTEIRKLDKLNSKSKKDVNN